MVCAPHQCDNVTERPSPQVWLRILLYRSIAGPREWRRKCPVVTKIADQPFPPSPLHIAFLPVHYPRVVVRMSNRWIFATDPRASHRIGDSIVISNVLTVVLPIYWCVLFEPGDKVANVRLTTLSCVVILCSLFRQAEVPWAFIFSGLICCLVGFSINTSDPLMVKSILGLPLRRRAPGHCCLVRVNQASYLIFDR